MALLNAVKYIGLQMGNIESMWQIVKCRIKQCWQVMNTPAEDAVPLHIPKIVLYCNLLLVSRCHMIRTFANKTNYFL